MHGNKKCVSNENSIPVRNIKNKHNCAKNILPCEKTGQGKGFYNAGFSEKELLEFKKQSLEKELKEINEKLEKL